MADFSEAYRAGVVRGLHRANRAADCPYGDEEVVLRYEWLRGFVNARPRIAPSPAPGSRPE